MKEGTISIIKPGYMFYRVSAVHAYGDKPTIYYVIVGHDGVIHEADEGLCDHLRQSLGNSRIEWLKQICQQRGWEIKCVS